jgi:hypothetical protein
MLLLLLLLLMVMVVAVRWKRLSCLCFDQWERSMLRSAGIPPPPRLLMCLLLLLLLLHRLLLLLLLLLMMILLLLLLLLLWAKRKCIKSVSTRSCVRWCPPASAQAGNDERMAPLHACVPSCYLEKGEGGESGSRMSRNV